LIFTCIFYETFTQCRITFTGKAIYYSNTETVSYFETGNNEQMNYNKSCLRKSCKILKKIPVWPLRFKDWIGRNISQNCRREYSELFTSLMCKVKS